MSSTGLSSTVEVRREYAAGIDAPCPVPTAIIRFLLDKFKRTFGFIFFFDLDGKWDTILASMIYDNECLNFVFDESFETTHMFIRSFVCDFAVSYSSCHIPLRHGLITDTLHQHIHRVMDFKYHFRCIHKYIDIGHARILRSLNLCHGYSFVECKSYLHTLDTNYFMLILSLMSDGSVFRYKNAENTYLRQARFRALRAANKYVRPLCAKLNDRHVQMILLAEVLKFDDTFELENLHELACVLKWSLDKGVRESEPTQTLCRVKFMRLFDNDKKRKARD